MAQTDDREIWVADSETDPFELGVIPKPFIWGVYRGYEGSQYWEFDSTEKFIEFIRKKRIILYAHNGGKFDWHFLSPWFEPDGELLVINGRLAKFTIGQCEFRDSYNLMPVALEQYQKQKFDYDKMHHLVRHKHMDEIREYLKSDCVNLWWMVYGFINNYGLHLTQASAAMHFWKYRLRNKVPRSTDQFYDHFHPWYYGGRVQCFAHGDIVADPERPFIGVDINSAYPTAMLSEHPYSLDYRVIHKEPKTLPREQWGPLLFLIDAIPRGCFPFRGTNGNLYYPADDVERRYYVTGWELLAGIETGTLDQVKFLETYQFKQTQNFSAYVMYFWNLRQQFKKEGDKGGEFYCKIFLNALYGKFAMDIRKHKQYFLYPQTEKPRLLMELMNGQTIQDFREWCILAVKNPIGKKRFYNLATAASITGHVRATLWRAICDSTRPLYCDTDSIVAQGFGPSITFGAELGQWGEVGKFDRVVIGGKKLYAMHTLDNQWKLASKGARLTAAEIIRVAAGEAVHYDNIVPTFSTGKSQPVFIGRDIVSTARDIRTVPRCYDPTFSDDPAHAEP